MKYALFSVSMQINLITVTNRLDCEQLVLILELESHCFQFAALS